MTIQSGVYLMGEQAASVVKFEAHTMPGVPDEHAVLQEGEIFCQWQDPEDSSSKPSVVTGDVMICRAPAMHMGDIRRVRAVDHPRLRHLVNVIVFNVRGNRDLPNQV